MPHFAIDAAYAFDDEPILPASYRQPSWTQDLGHGSHEGSSVHSGAAELCKLLCSKLIGSKQIGDNRQQQ